MAIIKMQLPNIPNAEDFDAVCDALQRERIGRYKAAADHDWDLAFRFLLWNMVLCEAFYIPVQFAEVVYRNRLCQALRKKLGNDWYENSSFQGLLDERHRRDLLQSINDQRAQHDPHMTQHHIVSSLRFSFWQHLTTKRFQRLLWINGLKAHFPNAPAHKNRDDLYQLVNTIRKWRNRIAHHEAIFDKGPAHKYEMILELVRWGDTKAAKYLASIARVHEAIRLRPKKRDLFSD